MGRFSGFYCLISKSTFEFKNTITAENPKILITSRNYWKSRPNLFKSKLTLFFPFPVLFFTGTPKNPGNWPKEYGDIQTLIELVRRGWLESISETFLIFSQLSFTTMGMKRKETLKATNIQKLISIFLSSKDHTNDFTQKAAVAACHHI